jgi:hypothetical protein
MAESAEMKTPRGKGRNKGLSPQRRRGAEKDKTRRRVLGNMGSCGDWECTPLAGKDLESAESAEIKTLRARGGDLNRESLRRPGLEGNPSGLVAVRIRPPIVRAAPSMI